MVDEQRPCRLCESSYLKIIFLGPKLQQGPDADQFKPERHLDANGQLATAPPDTKDGELFYIYTYAHVHGSSIEGHVGYGFGRRICVGRHVANNSVYIDIVSLLWGTTIAPLKDAQGKPIMPDTEGFVNDGLVL